MNINFGLTEDSFSTRFSFGSKLFGGHNFASHNGKFTWFRTFHGLKLPCFLMTKNYNRFLN